MALSDGLSPLQSFRMPPVTPERHRRLRHQCLWPASVAMRRMQVSLLRHPGCHPLHAPRPLLPLRQPQSATHLRPLRRGRVQVSLEAPGRPCLPLPQLPQTPFFLAPAQTDAAPHFTDHPHRLIPGKSPAQLFSFHASAGALQYPVRGERFFVAIFQLQLTRAPFLRILNLFCALFARSRQFARKFVSHSQKFLCNSCS